jgi:hypothetical protein
LPSVPVREFPGQGQAGSKHRDRGHECDSSTAVYTHVSDDYMNTALRRALEPALGPAGGGRK